MLVGSCLSLQSPVGDLIDCVLSHQQPAFDHPQLKGQKPLVLEFYRITWYISTLMVLLGKIMLSSSIIYVMLKVFFIFNFLNEFAGASRETKRSWTNRHGNWKLSVVGFVWWSMPRRDNSYQKNNWARHAKSKFH